MKSTKGAGKNGKGTEARKETCYFCNETEDGCNRGQHSSSYRRKFNPDEKKYHVCGSTKDLVAKGNLTSKVTRLVGQLKNSKISSR